MNEIFTQDAPVPAGHYSQAIEHGGMVFVSGQLPVVPGKKDYIGSIEEQTLQVLKNLEAVLIAAKSSKANVLKTTVYVADVKLWDQVNREYAKFFGRHRPARTIVPTQKLHFDFQIEIDAIAAVIE